MTKEYVLRYMDFFDTILPNIDEEVKPYDDEHFYTRYDFALKMFSDLAHAVSFESSSFFGDDFRRSAFTEIIKSEKSGRNPGITGRLLFYLLKYKFYHEVAIVMEIAHEYGLDKENEGGYLL